QARHRAHSIIGVSPVPRFPPRPTIESLKAPERLVSGDKSKIQVKRAKIGVGTNLVFAPPSEPDWQISCIRLSSWWLAFKKIGVPQCVLVLRRTSPPRRSRYLAIGSDLFLWPGLFASSGA